MNDYISREAAISEFAELQELARKRAYDTPTNSPIYMRYATQAQEREDAVRRIMAIPAADVVEVVRCRECKHNKKSEALDVNCEKNHDFVQWLSPDFYCADGERKDGPDNGD